jgi:hypothetical protein
MTEDSGAFKTNSGYWRQILAFVTIRQRRCNVASPAATFRRAAGHSFRRLLTNAEKPLRYSQSARFAARGRCPLRRERGHFCDHRVF